MRDILFKAKRKCNGVWVQGYYYEMHGKSYILFGMMNGTPIMMEVFPETLCQYTGMDDKNGNRIWENDILEIKRFFPYSVEHSKVVYCESEAQFEVHDRDGFNSSLGVLSPQEIKIIGNVFDNPELPEVEE